MRLAKAALLPVAALAISFAGGSRIVKRDIAQDGPTYVQMRQFEEAMGLIQEHFVDQVDAGEAYDAALRAVVNELGDHNSSFVPASDYRTMRVQTRGEYAGIGLDLMEQDGYAAVASLISGSPGAEAGLRTGDRLLSIDDAPLANAPTHTVQKLLQGEAGTSVKLTVQRMDPDSVLTLVVERAPITVPSVPLAEIMRGHVGYIRVQQFNATTTEEVRAALSTLAARGMQSILLDLRGNPGGILEQGAELAELFLDTGLPIVETRGRGRGQSQIFVSRTPESYAGMPVAILVQEGTASAAEIFAGALQDHGRAVVIGRPTYGKGSVQSLFQLAAGDVLKLTTARWFTPNGRSIQREDDDHVSARDAVALSGEFVRRPPQAVGPDTAGTEGDEPSVAGGIMPDVWAMPDTLTDVERDGVRVLFQSGPGLFPALQSWASDHVRRTARTVRPISLQPKDLVFLQREFQMRGGQVNMSDLQAARRYLEYHIGREVALQENGRVGEARYTMARDKQLHTALDLMAEATTPSDLSRSVTGRGRADWSAGH